MLLDLFAYFAAVAPRGRCEKCCWTYFTLGRASAAVKNIVGPIPPSVAPQCPPLKMLLNVFHLWSRPALLQKMLSDLFRANQAHRPHGHF